MSTPQKSHLTLVKSSQDDEAGVEQNIGATTGPATKGGDDPPPPPDRKFKAKRLNELVKAVYSLANTLAAATIATAFIVPAIKSETTPNELDRPGWVVIGLSLHIFGLLVIWFVSVKEE